MSMPEFADLRRQAPASRRSGHPIMAGYDGSPASKHALAYAAGLARRSDRWLIVVRISKPGGLKSAPLTPAAIDCLRAELADADLSGLDVEIIWRIGDPAAELLKLTTERQADAIVIGAARRLRHLMPLPARLVRHARCPAVVVPLRQAVG